MVKIASRYSGGELMKKIMAIFLGSLLCLPSTALASTRIVGEALNTDIRAYIDEIPIRSYNIGGKTGIVAEDLRDYGFEVIWYPDLRELIVAQSDSTATGSGHVFKETTEPVGSHAAYVYETDIVTYVGGRKVEAFNIGGETVIYVDDMEAFGDVKWDEASREVHFTTKTPWEIDLSDGIIYAEHQQQYPYIDPIDGFSAEFIKNENGRWDVTETNLGHLSWIRLSFDKRYGGLQLGFSLVAYHMMADDDFSALCTEMCTIGYDGSRWKDGAELAREHTKIYINDELMYITDVRMGKGNNHQDYYFILDKDIQMDDVNKITVECWL